MSIGRPTLLDDHLFREIKRLVLDGNNLREISDILEISYATMRDWEYENYKGFSDRMLAFKHERMMLKAENQLEVLQESEDERISLQANTFVLETLNKRKYSKRTEQTGAEGQAIQQIVVNYVKPNEVVENGSNI